MNAGSMHKVTQSRGFSLVEILVALAIGLLTTLVIMQVFSGFEGGKRTVTAASGAQTNGSIALYTLTRDLQMAGFGLIPVTNSALECTTSATTWDATRNEPTVDHDNNPVTPPIGIIPVIITDGGAGPGASDTITIRSGQSPMGGVPTKILAPAGNVLTVENSLACQANDIAILINGSSCSMTRVAASSPPQPTTSITVANGLGATTDAQISCVGAWDETVYRTNNGVLERNGIPLIDGIVSLQAQYGISATPGNNQIIQWVNASDAGWSTPSVADRNRIKAVRIAVTARSTEFDSNEVTAAQGCNGVATALACAWDENSAAPQNPSPAPAIDVSNDPDWRHYRYRTFETIVPLRNVVWSAGTLL